MLGIDQYLAQTDTALFFVVGVAATLVYVLKLGLDLVAGLGDLHLEHGHVADAAAETGSAAAFSLFSILSILGFFMGFGWMGLMCRVNWGLGTFVSTGRATAFGGSLLAGTAGLLYWVRKMNHVPAYDPRSAVGRTGRVYLTVPPKGDGQGQIQITVSGRRKVMPAVSAGDAISAFESARVVGLKGRDVLIVEPGTAERFAARRGRWKA